MAKKRKKTKRVKASESESGLSTNVSEFSEDDGTNVETNGEGSPKLSTKMRVLVERIINRITHHGTIDGFSEQEIIDVLEESYQQLRPLPALAHVSVPVVIFGDIHGQLSDLQRFLTIVGTPPKAKLLFLGDYVDRCNKGVEVALLLLCYKLRYPAQIDLLRGNHECQKLNRIYGFYTECRAKMSVRLWKTFQRVFYELPLCARVGKRILAMHGGISPDIRNWDSLISLKKPCNNEECDKGIPVDLMWSDPSRDDCTKGFQPNTDRGTSYIFGDDVVRNFNNKLDIDLVVRAHEVVRKGHLFNASQQMCTIFSAPNYCGSEGNCASVMRVSKNLEVSFVTLKPRPNTEAISQMSKRELLACQERFLRANAKSPKPGTKHSESAFVLKNIPPISLESDETHTARETPEKQSGSEPKPESPGANQIPDQFDPINTHKGVVTTDSTSTFSSQQQTSSTAPAATGTPAAPAVMETAPLKSVAAETTSPKPTVAETTSATPAMMESTPPISSKSLPSEVPVVQSKLAAAEPQLEVIPTSASAAPTPSKTESTTNQSAEQAMNQTSGQSVSQSADSTANQAVSQFTDPATIALSSLQAPTINADDGKAKPTNGSSNVESDIPSSTA